MLSWMPGNNLSRIMCLLCVENENTNWSTKIRKILNFRKSGKFSNVSGMSDGNLKFQELLHPCTVLASATHGCCHDGWKITLPGSKFLSQLLLEEQAPFLHYKLKLLLIPRFVLLYCQNHSVKSRKYSQ